MDVDTSGASEWMISSIMRSWTGFSRNDKAYGDGLDTHIEKRPHRPSRVLGSRGLKMVPSLRILSSTSMRISWGSAAAEFREYVVGSVADLTAYLQDILNPLS
jgi:hypothetical protein